jgi:catechol 2,3-dioxygenase-like lactoylglutathione lyase family enzyme
MHAKLTPELDVSDLARSIDFYRGTCGFAALSLEGVLLLMLQQAGGPGRRFRTAPLEAPFGRGISLQIEVGDAVALYGRLPGAGCEPVLELEDRWYRAADACLGSRQFVVADPDGYLLRFFEALGNWHDSSQA